MFLTKSIKREGKNAFIKIGNWNCLLKNMAEKTDEELIEIAKKKEKKWLKANKESEKKKEIFKNLKFDGL